MRARRRRAATAVSIRPKISSSTRRRDSGSSIVHSTSRSTGTKSSSSTCGRTTRPGHDLPATGSPAAGPTATHLPVGKRRHLYLSWRRCRRWIRRISHHSDRRARRTPTRSSTSRRGIAWHTGRATRSWSTPSLSSIRHGSGAAVSSTPIRCMSWSGSRVRAMHLHDVTVEDPEVLVEPWVLPTRVVRRNTNPNAGLLRERGNCETSFETEAAATQIRH